ncbi:MAG: polysaccharide biosynthesis C-terminal domain-containing protein [bacterium]|nr:polysaccharide biosynthesis C-terminal domain-containing protein [bacterium]
MSENRRTAVSMAVVSTASLMQIVNQFLFFKVNASLYGATAETDPLWFALAIPTFLVAVVTGSLSYVLVPELVARFEQAANQRDAWRLASFVGLLTLLASATISAIVYLGAEPICRMLFAEKVPGQHALAVEMLQILSVQVLLTGGISWAQSVLHSRHQFAVAALGGVVGTAAGLAMVFLYGDRGIQVVAWAINLGSLISLIIHLLPILSSLAIPYADASSIWRLCSVFWPLLLGAIFLRVSPLVDRVWASQLDPGSLTRINYADRIVMALLTIGTSSLSLIAFPQLAEHLASHGKQGFSRHFSLCFRRMILLIVPIAIGVGVFSLRIVSDLLEGKMFTPEDSHVVGLLVAILMGMFVGASLSELLARGFYVLGDTKAPTMIGVIGLSLGLLMKYALFQFVGIWGIALGIALHFLLTTGILAVSLVRRAGAAIFEGVGWYLLQASLASLLACGCCFLVYARSIGNTWVAGPVGGVAYFLGLLLVHNAEAKQVLRAISDRIRKGFRNSGGHVSAE